MIRVAKFKFDLSNLQRQFAFFTKSHKRCVSMKKHDNVFLIISDFNVAVQLLYIKQLVHDYQQNKMKTRRIHLI